MNLRQRLIEHEGLRLKPYRCTAGKLTIGVGRNLEDVGISEEEAMQLLENDIARARQAVARAFPWATAMVEARQSVLIEMVFQMGLQGVLGFSRTLQAMKAGRYTEAAAFMLESLWAKQTPARAKRLARIMATGEEV